MKSNYDASDDPIFSALTEEYSYHQESLERTNDRMLQLLVIGLTFLGILLGYILNQQQGFTLSYGFAWLAPTLLLLIWGLFLLTYYFATDRVWILRLLSTRINKLIGEVIYIGHQRDMPSNVFFSSSKGNLKFRFLFPLLIGGALLLFLVISYICFDKIYGESHWAGTLFIVIYGSIACFELWSLSGLLFDLPDLYRKLEQQALTLNRMPSIEEFQSIINRVKPSVVFAHILPRPLDLALKGGYFWGGFLLALYVIGMNESRVGVLNHLFRGASDWPGISSIPTWAIISYGLLIFVISELGLQQAKFLWDDIRDAARDQQLPFNKSRPVTAGVISVKSAKRNIIIRTILSFAVGYVLGGINIVGVLLAVVIHEAIYLLGAKRVGRKYPWLQLFTLSFNLSLRFLTGVIAVADQHWSMSIFLLVSIMFYFYSFGGMAASWKMEAIYFKEKLGKGNARPQSSYFMEHGNFWQHVGLLVSTISSLLAILFNTTDVGCQSQIIIYSYGPCNPSASHQIIYVAYSPLSAVASMAIIVCAVFLSLQIIRKTLGVLLYILSQPIAFLKLELLTSRIASLPLRFLKSSFIQLKPTLLAFSLAAFVLPFMYSMFNKDTIILLYSLFALNVFMLIQYEEMSYPEISWEDFQRKLRLLGKAIDAYLFQPSL